MTEEMRLLTCFTTTNRKEERGKKRKEGEYHYYKSLPLPFCYRYIKLIFWSLRSIVSIITTQASSHNLNPYMAVRSDFVILHFLEITRGRIWHPQLIAKSTAFSWYEQTGAAKVAYMTMLTATLAKTADLKCISLIG